MAKDVFHFSNEYGIHGCRGTVYSMKEKIETETDTKTKLKKKQNKTKLSKRKTTIQKPYSWVNVLSCLFINKIKLFPFLLASAHTKSRILKAFSKI